MFDNPTDRNNYEAFIHAIYKRYNIVHDPIIATAGEPLITECLVHPEIQEVLEQPTHVLTTA